jgi:hypothetical protein
MTSLKRLYGDTLIVESPLVGARQLSRLRRRGRWPRAGAAEAARAA